MTEFDLPIFKKSYDLYKNFSEFRSLVAKQYKHTICERVEHCMLDVMENILRATHLQRIQKLPILEETSVRLNLLRVFIRLMKDTKAIDTRKYAILQADVDEIGRMLGGWIKSTRES